MPYLSARGVSREVAAEFGLGLCTTGKTIPGRLGIPIHDAEGQVVAYAGRWVGPDEEIPEDQGKYQLPAKFHKQGELFNLHRVKGCQTLAIVEGFFGAVRLYGSVRPRIPAVALMGGSISEEQVALLLEHCPALRFVTVCLDADEPVARRPSSWPHGSRGTGGCGSPHCRTECSPTPRRKPICSPPWAAGARVAAVSSWAMSRLPPPSAGVFFSSRSWQPSPTAAVGALRRNRATNPEVGAAGALSRAPASPRPAGSGPELPRLGAGARG